MKKIIFTIFLSTIIFCGCEFALDHENAAVFFSPKIITKESFDSDMVQNTFDTEQLIYFCVYSKTPFNSNEGRMQILKKDPKTQLYGYSLERSEDIIFAPAKNYYMGSFTIFSEGYYLLRIFNKNNPKEPLAQNSFWISQ